MGKNRTRYYGASYVNIENFTGQKIVFREFRKSKKVENLSMYSKVNFLKANDAYRIWQKTKSKTARNRFMRAFNKLYGYDKRKKVQYNSEAGKIKNIGGVKSISTQRTRYRTNKKAYADYNSIRSYEAFLANQAVNQSVLKEHNLIGKMNQMSAFLNDTDTGWTRRVMEKIGISDEISIDEFHSWLVGRPR